MEKSGNFPIFVILYSSEITLLIFFTSEISLLELCMLFHQYVSVFH